MTTERLLHEARARLGELNHDLAIAIGTAATPDDLALIEIDQAIDAQNAKIQRLERMFAAGKVAATAEARRALMKKREDGMANANRLAKERIALAGKIDEAIAAIGPLLKQWADLGAECQRSAADVNRGIRDFGWHDSMLISARGNAGAFSAALESALWQAGVGSEGIYSHSLSTFYTSGKWSLKSAAERTAERLEAQLENILNTAIKKDEE